ncbi:unnamed protein product [Discosporangium mesarthrocarpum]
MVYEEVFVIGFGIALAAITVGLFWAHAMRINAPNNLDPGGVMVDIDLSQALASDQEARIRRKIGGRKGASGNGGGVASPDGVIGKLGSTVGTAGFHITNEETCTSMILPTARYARALVSHAVSKRKSLRSLAKHDGMRWKTQWAQISLDRRRKLLASVRAELLHAVSLYIGGKNSAVFNAVCPELNMADLEGDFNGVSGMERLVQLCLGEKCANPKTRVFAAVREALAKAAAERCKVLTEAGAGTGAQACTDVDGSTAMTKNRAGAAVGQRAESNVKVEGMDNGALRAYLPTFRRLCLCSFSLRVLEEISRERTDQGGVTVGSFAKSLVKTSISGLLMYCFFCGLQETSRTVSGGVGGQSSMHSTLGDGVESQGSVQAGLSQPSVGDIYHGELSYESRGNCPQPSFF